MRFNIIIYERLVLFLRLKDLREDSDIKQRDIAEYLHIRQNTYSQYENEQRQLPIDVLISLAKFYNVSTDYILGLTNIKKPYPQK
ncbi:MAG: helix-turn-helix transcriptional regulator [Oscillospiraceae bacterium]|nr:helix-turn-helix transcriptional regulator [Oscillospiraceae bacterium]